MFGNLFAGAPGSTPEWRAFFLDRLHRLLLHPARGAVDRSVQRAIYSTYLDCRAMGATAEAESLLAQFLGYRGPEPRVELAPMRSSDHLTRRG